MGPLLSQYLKALPDGLDSYPESEAKASLLRNFVGLHPLEHAHLPDEIALLITHTPPSNLWIPEVHFVAFCMEYVDQLFADRMDAFYEEEAERTRRLFKSPAYRMLMVLVTPRMLLRGTVLRFDRFHRGCEVTIEAQSHTARLQLQFPEGLFSPLFLKMLAISFEVGLEVAGASHSTADVSEQDLQHAVFDAEWD